MSSDCLKKGVHYNSYQIKMKLMAPEAKQEIAVDTDDQAATDPLSTEINSYYAEQTPIVNDTDKKNLDWLDAQDRKREKWDSG